MTTYPDIFDNNTEYINAAAYSATTKTLSITFANDLNPSQATAAVLQSIIAFLITNQDQTINLAAQAPTRNTSIRNNIPKDQINYSIQIFTPPSTVSFNPLDI
jgi:hypothetical protein